MQSENATKFQTAAAKVCSVLPACVKPEDAAKYLAHTAYLTGANLPVIIDTLGEYRTRGGRKVMIFKIGTPDLATCHCQGILIIPKRKGFGVIRRFQAWQPNGRNVILGETQRDIVAKL